MTDALAVVIALKSFHSAKSRLRASLPDVEVDTLVRQLAEDMVSAAAGWPTTIVSTDRDVREWAAGRSCAVHAGGVGLNDSLQRAVAAVRAKATRIVIAHADVWSPGAFVDSDFSAQVTICTDRHGTGTNVLVIPAHEDFTFRFGATSARDHHAEALHRGLTWERREVHPWSLDIDDESDFHFAMARDKKPL